MRNLDGIGTLQRELRFLRRTNQDRDAFDRKFDANTRVSRRLTEEALTRFGGGIERTLVLGAGYGNDIPKALFERSESVVLSDIDERAVETFLSRNPGYFSKAEVVIADLSGINAGSLPPGGPVDGEMLDRLVRQPLFPLPFKPEEHQLIVSHLVASGFPSWMISLAADRSADKSFLKNAWQYPPLGRKLITHHISEILRLLPPEGMAAISIWNGLELGRGQRLTVIPPQDNLSGYISRLGGEIVHSLQWVTTDNFFEGAIMRPFYDDAPSAA